jgi:hypothetical protein
LRWAEQYRRDTRSIRNILVATPDGSQVPLGQLAELVEEEGPSVPNLGFACIDGRRRLAHIPPHLRSNADLVPDTCAPVTELAFNHTYRLVFSPFAGPDDRLAKDRCRNRDPLVRLV